MGSSRFDQLILNKIHRSINRIILMSAFISWLSAIAVYFSTIPRLYVWLDLGIGVVLFAIYILKDRLESGNIVIITASIPIILGVLTFMDGGFTSGTIILMLLGNAIAMLLLRKKMSNIVAMITMIVLIFLWVWTEMTEFNPTPKMTGVKWIIHILLFVLFLFIFRISVNAIKSYLVENIENLESSVELTKKLAYYDLLTGLPNYNYFTEYLGKLNCEENPQGIILIISIKNLNMINALYGNENGNQTILSAGKIIKEAQKDCDLAARVSSNEFVIWISQKQGNEVLEDKRSRLLDSLHAEIEIAGVKRYIEFYASYAKMDIKNESFESCFQKAQVALTYAKHTGKDSLVSYDEKFDGKIKRFSNLKELIKNDICTNKNILLYYQPQIESTREKVVSVEALSRWSTDSYGIVSPSEFIPIIEELNLHEKFGIIVIKKAFSDYPVIKRKYGDKTTLSINIAPSFLMSRNFTDQILQLLEEFNFNPDNLTLEITEEMVIEGIELINNKLAPLRNKGVKISLDDFGTGFSSLSYLSQLDVDELKLDKSLIDQVTVSEKSNILIETLIQLAKKYNMTIVAEGVESKEQFEMLKSMGCTLIQGYYFSKAEKL